MIISSAALSEAVNLCAINNKRFSAIGVRAFNYLETAGVLNQIEVSEADDLFLSLVLSEIEEDDDDTAFEKNSKVWAQAA